MNPSNLPRRGEVGGGTELALVLFLGLDSALLLSVDDLFKKFPFN